MWLALAGLSIPGEGMIILVDPEVEPRNGKLVVAKLEGENEATFKKLVIDAGRKFLKPLIHKFAQWLKSMGTVKSLALSLMPSQQTFLRGFRPFFISLLKIKDKLNSRP